MENSDRTSFYYRSSYDGQKVDPITAQDMQPKFSVQLKDLPTSKVSMMDDCTRMFPVF